MTFMLPMNLADAAQQLPEHLAERLRVIIYGDGKSGEQAKRLAPGPVVYWTHHAQRTDENPALDIACLLACALHRPLLVYQGLSQSYRFASDRHHVFQLQAAQDLERSYRELGIRYVLNVETANASPRALLELARMASLMVTDDFPGEPTTRWLQRLAVRPSPPLLAVDTACVVPMRLVGKAFDRAYAYRDATQALYRERIARPWPRLPYRPDTYEGPIPFPPQSLEACDLHELAASCRIDHGVAPVADTPGGSAAGYARWNRFRDQQLRRYAAQRNDPCSGVSSRMSAYLHYGMVSPMRLAREVQSVQGDKYLDELLIWRELAYSYCFYRSDFDQLSTLPEWAVRTLRAHEHDPRPAIYSWETLSRGKTDDRLWNACQASLLKHGELHNNVRMTWGKALLRWTRNPAEALRMLIDLNHRYALDGRDPASYGGILWCLGQFDRPFEPERPILGTVRDRTTTEHSRRLNLDAFEKQVHRPISKRKARIAIIGAGVSGLMCARTLRDHGIEVEVFEKSRGPGGRCATRRTADGSLLDHGPPYAMFRDPRWKPFLESWQQHGILTAWQGRVVQFSEEGIKEAFSPCERWVGVPGMNAIGKHLAFEVPIRTMRLVTHVEREGEDCRLTVRCVASDSSNTASPDSETKHEKHGPFDVVVWSCPPAQVEPMLPEACSWRTALRSHGMDPCWVALVNFDHSWSVPFDGAWVTNPCVQWMGRESSKPGRAASPDTWVIHASADWSRNHLEDSAEQVVEAIFEHVQSMGLAPLPNVLAASAHRWRYASKASLASIESDASSECLWDATLGLGACGDGVGASGLEGALNSGRAMAGRILGWLTSHGPEETGMHSKGSQSEYRQLELWDT